MTEADPPSPPSLAFCGPPPELQDCGAGPSVDQTKLFGPFARTFHQIQLPNESEEAFRSKEIIVRAYTETTGRNPGPVHLNFPFREPLVYQDEKPVKIDLPERVDLSESPSGEVFSKTDEIVKKLGSGKRLLVIAGENAPLETFSKWHHPESPPILCDSLSPLRETPAPTRILRFENLLRSKDFRPKARPDAILQLGPLPTSKTLRNWLGELDSPISNRRAKASIH